MLVLSRKPGQTIQVGPDVTIHLLVLRNGNSRIGITAPSGVHILRGELVELPQDQLQASLTEPTEPIESTDTQ